MLKKDVKYTDFDDNEQSETLYFNISKTELADNIHLKDQVEDIQKLFQGEPRTLTTDEVRSILNLVKTFARLAYGQKSEDGRRFKKTPELWEDFTQTAAYDEFMMSLFMKPEEAFGFLVAVMPKDLRDQATEIAQQQHPDLFEDAGVHPADVVAEVTADPEPIVIPVSDIPVNEATESVDTRPIWEQEDRDPTPAEIREATPDQISKAWARKASR